jgi:hypothetical protein
LEATFGGEEKKEERKKRNNKSILQPFKYTILMLTIYYVIY